MFAFVILEAKHKLVFFMVGFTLALLIAASVFC